MNKIGKDVDSCRYLKEIVQCKISSREDMQVQVMTLKTDIDCNKSNYERIIVLNRQTTDL